MLMTRSLSENSRRAPIWPSACALTMTRPVGSDSVSKNDSSPSLETSVRRIGTLTVSVVWPGLNTSVPLVAV